jgi:hypothetical protein
MEGGFIQCRQSGLGEDRDERQFLTEAAFEHFWTAVFID